jgi:hypothetical protein
VALLLLLSVLLSVLLVPQVRGHPQAAHLQKLSLQDPQQQQLLLLHLEVLRGQLQG